MYRVRKVATSSGKTAVQITTAGHDYKIVKHIGSAKEDGELKNLVGLAYRYVNTKERKMSLFPEITADLRHDIVSIDKVDFTSYKHTFAYEFLEKYYNLNGFGKIGSTLLKDLAIIRICKPASKIKSIEYLKRYFGISYTRNILFKNLLSLNGFKDEVERRAVITARRHFSFDFTMVFFDVTTLYFETFKEDDENFKKAGFSKDNKSNQPQILVSLIVTKEGYPISIEVFEGNKFEGHTIIPAIEKFITNNGIQNLTVVADAAMISFENVGKLNSCGLNYIVGARISNLPLATIKKANSFLDKKEGVYFQIRTKHGVLICDYSRKRANKNRSDRKRQITKAKEKIKNPSKFTKGVRFLKHDGKTSFHLNHKLIEKDELLEGIKGYYTNLEETHPSIIVSRYKDLWHVEKAFRIAKSDLLARPIYHFKKQNIQAHILIVFTALCVAKSIELKTGKSIQRVLDKIWDIIDITLEDGVSGKKYVKRLIRKPP